MITLPSLSIAVLSLFLGHLLQKYNRKPSMIVALVLFCAFGSAGLYLTEIENLLVSRLLFGISVAMLMILTTSLIGDYFSGEQRHKYMGLQSAMASVDGIFFLVGGGYLSDLGWRYPFGIYLIGLFFYSSCTSFLIEPKHVNKAQEEMENKETNLTFVFILGFVLMLIFYVLQTQMPFLIINHFGASGSLTGAIIATAFVANALGALSFSKLKKHFQYKTI